MGIRADAAGTKGHRTNERGGEEVLSACGFHGSVLSVADWLGHFTFGGVYGSGVPIGMSGLFFVVALNSPTIFNIGVTTQVSAVGFSSRGSV